MKNTQKLSLLSLFISFGIFAQPVGVESSAKVVEKSQVTLTGSIFKSNDSEFATFDVTMGDGEFSYKMAGTTSTRSGMYKSTMSFSPVKIRKEINTADGRIFRKEIDNKGSLAIYPREREASSDLVLAGISIGGKMLDGLVDDGIWFNGLTVDGVMSTGNIDYFFANGHYTPSRNCSFGDSAISSANPSENAIFNYDDSRLFTSKNMYKVQMNFGSLVVEGTINFADDTKRVRTGKRSSTTVVTATTGGTALNIKRKDGKPLKLSMSTTEETEDEKSLRKYLAFLQIITFDTFSE